MKKLKFAIFALVAVLTLMACSNDKAAGTVTDTGNTVAEADYQVAGVVLRVDGTPASEAVVRMARMAVIDSVLHVPEQIEVVTDTDGVYAFDSAIADTFQLAVIDTSAVEVFFLPRTTLKAKAFDSIQLEKAAVVSSVLYFDEVEDSSISVGGHFVTCLSGTPFCNDVFAADSFYMLVPAQELYPLLPDSKPEPSSLYNFAYTLVCVKKKKKTFSRFSFFLLLFFFFLVKRNWVKQEK